MKAIIRFSITISILTLMVFPAVQAVTYVPVVEWNGIRFNVMNGSGVYDLQPVAYPVVDVPFFNSNGLVVWSVGGNDFTAVVDSYHDRLQFFTANIEYAKYFSGESGNLDWGNPANHGEFNALIINLPVTGNIVRGSEQVFIDGQIYTRVADLSSYPTDSLYYEIAYEGGGPAAAGVITTPGELTRDSEITVKLAVTVGFSDKGAYYRQNHL